MTTVCIVLEVTKVPSLYDREGIIHVKFTLHIRRMPMYYIVNLIIPCCLLSFLTLFTFLLQPGVPQRSTNGAYMYFM